MPDDREQSLLKQLRELRSQFQTKYKRSLTPEEQRMLDFAEQLLTSYGKLKKGAGE